MEKYHFGERSKGPFSVAAVAAEMAGSRVVNKAKQVSYVWLRDCLCALLQSCIAMRVGAATPVCDTSLDDLQDL